MVVTGGGSGIGADIVRGFARQKARVFFLDIAEKDSRALAAELGDAAEFVKCDLLNLDAAAATRWPRSSSGPGRSMRS